MECSIYKMQNVVIVASLMHHDKDHQLIFVGGPSRR